MALLIEIPLFHDADWLPFGFIESMLSAVFLWPALSLLIISEFLYYLEGDEEHADAGEKEQAPGKAPEADYGELEELYRKYYRGRYIDTLEIQANTPPAGGGKASSPVIEGIKRKLAANKLKINGAFVKHIENIAAGRDVIIDSSIYSEFGEYLYPYLNMRLARGESILFVCPDEQQMEQLAAYTEERLELINSYHPIWRMKMLRGRRGAALEDNDILFATPQFVRDEKVFEGFRSFFDKLSAVIIVNAAEVMAKDNLPLSLLSFKLASLLKTRASAAFAIQFICLSESIPLGIRKALVETLRLSDHFAVGDAYQVYDNTKIMLWRYEDPEAPIAQDKIFKSRAEAYWGMALPLASIALKHGVDMVSIMARADTPYAQMLDSMKGRQQKLGEFFGSVPVDLDSQIAFNRHNRKNRYARFAIIDDGHCNLPMALYNSGRFGGTRATMIHIVSKPYMLRDFFFANAAKYLTDESSINMFMPATADTLRISVFRLLYEMQKSGLPENEIRERVAALTDLPSGETDSERTVSALRFCLKTALRREGADSVYNHFSFKQRAVFNAAYSEFDEVYWVRLTDERLIADLMALNKLAVLRIRGQEYQSGFFADGILQRHLEGQYMVYDGHSYSIREIDARGGVMTLAEGPGDIDVPAGYTQIRKYYADNAAAEEVEAHARNFGSAWDTLVESLTVTHYRLPVTVKTLGYFTHRKTGAPLNFTESPQIDGERNLRMQSRSQRAYPAASALSLKLKGKLGDDTDRAAFLLAAIFNEFFKTWFPYSCDCVAVCPVLKDPGAILADDLGQYIAKLYPQLELAQQEEEDGGIELYIIEDSKTDLGIVQALIDSWQELFGRMLGNIQEYLDWQQGYKDREGGNISGRYLYFGKDSEPGCFDFETLREIFNELGQDRRVGTADMDAAAPAGLAPEKARVRGECSFCRGEFPAAQLAYLVDKRILCERCAKLAVTGEMKLRVLFSSVARYLSSEFDVAPAANINVRFAAAEAIRLRMGLGERAAASFADPAAREIWVESGLPAANLSAALVHALTRFWQFDNLPCDDLDYLEGHASYVELQYLRWLEQNSCADHLEAQLEKMEAPCGRGFRKLKQDLGENTNSFDYMMQLFGGQ